MTAPDAALVVACPDCEGRGEYGVRQDYWGNWETRTCGACEGMGEVTPTLAVSLLQRRDEQE